MHPNRTLSKNGSSVRSLMFARGISRMVLLPTPTMLPYMAICSRWCSIWFRPERSKMSLILSKPAGWLAASMSSQFLMDALYEANDAEYALHMLTKTDDRSWYNMIRVGSTISLEAWDNKYKPNQDWNHAWGAAPANIIPRRLMGVEPLTPGFGTARIKPQLASLEWAEATIPTIRGAIRMEVENKADAYILKVTIPANMDAEVYLPLPSGKYTVTNNGAPVKVSRVKGEPFLYAGKIGSGSYTFVVN